MRNCALSSVKNTLFNVLFVGVYDKKVSEGKFVHSSISEERWYWTRMDRSTVGQNPKFLAKTLKLNYFVVRFHTRGFSELLILNLKSDFSKTKWRLQNGGHFSKFFVRFAWNLIYEGFLGCWFQIWSQIFKKQNGGHFLKISVRFAWNLIYVGFWSCWF